MKKKPFDHTKFKIAAFDIDGTIYNNGRLHAATKESIMRLHESGVETILSTGRHPLFLPKEVLAIPCFQYAVALNGACVCDIRSGEIFSLIPLGEQAYAKDLLRFLLGYTDQTFVWLRDKGCMTDLCLTAMISADYAKSAGIEREQELRRMFTIVSGLTELMDAIKEPVLKIGSRFDTYEKTRKVSDLIRNSFDAEVAIVDMNTIEINRKNINKGGGLKQICERLSVDIQDTIVFGDSGNDLEMMKAAGYSVAMGNAPQFVKECADWVTEPFENNGVARAINALSENSVPSSSI